MMRGTKFVTRNLTFEEEKEIAERLEQLKNEAKHIEGTSPTVDISVRPDCFDEERFNAAQKAVNKYYSCVSMSSSFGLLLLLQLDEILIPLLKTGKSRTVAALCERYVATGKYIKKCYETRFHEPSSQGWHYINLVRSMHQRAFKMMNSPENNSLKKPDQETDKYVWVNQYDMALTQFAFIGLFIFRPDKCGAYHITEHELANVVYYWRLMSYQFGIEDRFNLFVYHDDMSKEVRLMSLLLDHWKQKLAVSRPQVGLEMARGIFLSFEDLTIATTFNIIEHHWAEVISLSGRDQLEPLSGLSERWKSIIFKLVFKQLPKSETVMKYMNIMYKRKFDKFCQREDKIKSKLAKKYPNHLYELEVDEEPTTNSAHSVKQYQTIRNAD